ncbi:hypothetical protein Tco_0771893, partial [Tanacetum coccineum]
MSDEESLMSEQGTIDNTDAPDTPNLEPHDEGMSSDDDVDEWFVTEMQMKTSEIDTVLEASSMASNDTVEEDSRTVENVLVKIDKFVFSWDFIVIDMPGILGEMMTLDKPFLATIHAQINVFNGEISFGIGEDRAKFDVNGNSHHSNITLKNVYMATKKESFNPLEIKDDLFSYEFPTCLRFEQNTRIHTNSDTETIDSPSNMQETSERCADHQQDNKRDTLRWHVCKTVRVFYDNGSGKDYGIWPTCNPDLSFCSGYKAVYGKGEHGMLKQWVCFRDHERRNAKGSCMKFAYFLHDHVITTALHLDNIHCPTPPLSHNSPHDDWHTKNHTTYNIGSSSDQSMPITTRVKIEHTSIANSDRENVFNEWVLDSFDVEADYAKMFANPYSRRLDEYKRIFINE